MSKTPLVMPARSTGSRLDPFNSTTWGDDEREYFQGIEAACREGRDALISNGLPEHAAFIIRLFLANAEQRVRLVTGGLPAVYGGVPMFGSSYIIATTMDFLTQPESKFQILLHGRLSDVDTIDNHPLVWITKRLARMGHLKGTLMVKQLSDHWERVLRDHDHLWHWMTMDESAYRIEGDIEKPEAVVNFGEPDYAVGLVGIFDELFADSAGNETLVSVTP